MAQAAVRALGERRFYFLIGVYLGIVLYAVCLILSLFQIDSKDGQLVIWVLDILISYFLLCLAFSGCCFEVKKETILERRQALDRRNDPSILGLDLVTGYELPLDRYPDDRCHLEVSGENQALRQMLMRILDYDVRRHPPIIIVAPEGEEGLLEEVTYVLRQRTETKEMKSFFYYSVNDPQRSVTYSPFYHGDEYLLRSWLRLDSEGAEALILGSILDALSAQKKPYELDDLLVLLEDKKGALALRSEILNRDYLLDFDSLKRSRASLAQKLNQFGWALKLHKYRITEAFPLHLRNIVESGKHLYLELENEPTFLTCYLLDHLRRLLSERSSSIGREAFVYLIYPEKFSHAYPIHEWFERIGYRVTFRVFSNSFYFPYHSDATLNTILLKGSSFSAAHMGEARFCDLVRRLESEKKRLRNQIGLKSLFNEETFEATKALIRELKLHDTASGFFTRPVGIGKLEYTVSWFYVPPKTIGTLAYEPYQKRYKPEDMLNLRKLMTKVKYHQSDYDLGVADIVQDLRVKDRT